MRNHLLVASAFLFVIASTSTADARRRVRGKEGKIGHYVYVINTAASSVFKARADYSRWVTNFKTGPTCTEPRVRGVRSPGYTKNVARDLMKVARQRPRLGKLDKKARQMAQALGALWDLQREASMYYRRRGHKKDNCAKARALHGKLVRAWAAYIDADRYIRNFVTKRNDARAAKQLKKIRRKYGKRMRYWRQRELIDAKATLAVLRAQMRSKQPDVLAMERSATKLGESVSRITELTERNRSVASTFGYRRFQRAASDYQKAVDQLIERIKTNKPLSKYQQKQLDRGATYVKGTFPAVIAKYNRMINQSNRLRFPRKVR